MLIVRPFSTLLTLSTAIIIFRFLLIFIYSIKNKKHMLVTSVKKWGHQPLVDIPRASHYLRSITQSSLREPMRKGGPHNESPDDTITCVSSHLR